MVNAAVPMIRDGSTHQDWLLALEEKGFRSREMGESPELTLQRTQETRRPTGDQSLQFGL